MATRSLLKAVVSGGLGGGALDMLFAVAFATYKGASASKVFQAIASGVLGAAAAAGGSRIEALGVALHFAMSLAWAALFATVAVCRPTTVRQPAIAAAAFGIVVFLCMRLIVLPLSAYPRPVTFQPLATLMDLLSHIFLFALPIRLAVAGYIRARPR